VKKTYQSTCVNFFSTIRTQNKIGESRDKISQFSVEDSLGLYKYSEKLSLNSFFLKFYVRICTEFGTKRDKFQVKRMNIHPRQKSNSFAHKRTFLSSLAVMNKKFIANLVGRIWGSNLSKKLTDTVTNVWKNFRPKYQGVRRSNSQSKSEQNWFSENKAFSLFFIVSSFYDLLIDAPPYLGENNISKHLREFFQHNTYSK